MSPDIEDPPVEAPSTELDEGDLEQVAGGVYLKNNAPPEGGTGI
jgi:hypothetical protein